MAIVTWQMVRDAFAVTDTVADPIQARELLSQALAPLFNEGGGGGGGAVDQVLGTFPVVVTPSTGVGSLTVSHAPSGVTAGVYGDAAHHAAVTLDAMGHVTAVTLHTFSTTDVVEGSQLYYTDARARAAMAGYYLPLAAGASNPLTGELYAPQGVRVGAHTILRDAGSWGAIYGGGVEPSSTNWVVSWRPDGSEAWFGASSLAGFAVADQDRIVADAAGVLLYGSIRTPLATGVVRSTGGVLSSAPLTVADISGATLQAAYNASTAPQITTDMTRGALQFRGGSPSPTNIVEFLDNIGDVRVSINTYGGLGVWEPYYSAGTQINGGFVVSSGDAGAASHRVCGAISADTAGAGPNVYWAGLANGVGLTGGGMMLQLSTANGLDVWSWNNTAWVKKSTLQSSGTLKIVGGTSAQFLRADGTVSVLAAGDIPGIDASKIISGTFADARIASAATWNAKLSTVTADATSRAANTVYAAPNGSAGTAVFRLLVAADIPSLDAGKITTGTFADARIASAATWNAKEPGITAGTTAQYWRGDKSWQTLNTTVVPEGTNLYYTDARARASISGSAPISYSSSTGVISHATSGITAGAYGSATQVPVVTYNATGHATGVTLATITPAWSNVTGKPTTISGYGITDANLQNAYDASTQPQITTSSAKGALQMQAGSGAPSAIVQYIDYNGYVRVSIDKYGNLDTFDPAYANAGTRINGGFVSSDGDAGAASHRVAGSIASDTAGAGPSMYWAGKAGGVAPTGGGALLQLSTANGLDFWSWNNTAWVKKATLQAAGTLKIVGGTSAQFLKADGSIDSSVYLTSTTGDTTSRAANTVYAAPNGSAGTATFRLLVAADIPNLDAAKITSGTFADARIASAATWNAKLGTVTADATSRAAKTFYAAPNGSAGTATFRAIVAADIPTLNQSTTGSAAKWTTSRTISATGDVAWSVSIDGSANASAAATVSAIDVTDNNSNSSSFPVVWSLGRTLNTSSGKLLFNPLAGRLTAMSFAGDFLGNATSATAWQTPRTLTIGATGKAVDGSANVSWSIAEIGAATASGTTNYIPRFSSSSSLVNSGLSDDGSSISASRGVNFWNASRPAWGTSRYATMLGGTTSIEQANSSGDYLILRTNGYYDGAANRSISATGHFGQFALTPSGGIDFSSVPNNGAGGVVTPATKFAVDASGNLSLLGTTRISSTGVGALTTLNLTGMRLRQHPSAAGYSTIYGASVAVPGSTNYSLLLAEDGTAAVLNGTTSSALKVGDAARVSALSTGAAVTGSLSATSTLSWGGAAAITSSDYVVQGTGAGALGHRTTKIIGATATPTQSGFYDAQNPADGPQGAVWTHMIRSAHSGNATNNQWMFDIAAAFGGGTATEGVEGYYVRTTSAGSTPGWRQLYHSGSTSITATPAHMGAWGVTGGSGYARFGHKDFNGGSGFGYLQNSDGSIFIECPSGKDINFRVAGSYIASTLGSYFWTSSLLSSGPVDFAIGNAAKGRLQAVSNDQGAGQGDLVAYCYNGSSLVEGFRLRGWDNTAWFQGRVSPNVGGDADLGSAGNYWNNLFVDGIRLGDYSKLSNNGTSVLGIDATTELPVATAYGQMIFIYAASAPSQNIYIQSPSSMVLMYSTGTGTATATSLAFNSRAAIAIAVPRYNASAAWYIIN